MRKMKYAKIIKNKIKNMRNKEKQQDLYIFLGPVDRVHRKIAEMDSQ